MITEDRRHRLYQRLEQQLGLEEATTLMEHLPPVGFGDVVTTTTLVDATTLLRADLDRAVAELRSEMADLSGQLRSEMAELRGQLRSEMADLRTEMADLRTELRTEMADLRTELRTEMADLRTELHRNHRTTVLALLASQAAFASVVVAAIGLIP